MLTRGSWLGPSAYFLIVGASLGRGEASAPAMGAASQPGPSPVTEKPVPRTEEEKAGWPEAHRKLVVKAAKGNVDLYFLGDSITNGWGGRGKQVFAKEFAGWNAEHFGIGGDSTQHVLWRIQNGEFDGVKPKAVVLMIGTNNMKSKATPEEIAGGVAAILKTIRQKQPQAKVLLIGIFPREEKPDDPLRIKVKETNVLIAKLADGTWIKFLDIGDKFLQPDGTISKEMMPDFLHPLPAGYQIWADAIKPTLREWLGPPKAK